MLAPRTETFTYDGLTITVREMTVADEHALSLNRNDLLKTLYPNRPIAETTNLDWNTVTDYVRIKACTVSVDGGQAPKTYDEYLQLPARLIRAWTKVIDRVNRVDDDRNSTDPE